MKSPIPHDLRGKTISNIIVVCVGIALGVAVALYAALKPYLTDAFRTIVNNNGGYWEYKALRPGDVAPAE